MLIPAGYGNPLHRRAIPRLLAELPQARIVDIRLSARTAIPGWSGAALHRRWGPRYLHLSSLGNMVYRQPGRIQVADLEGGVKDLLRLLDSHQVLLLLCGCAAYERCHRRLICEHVSARDPSLRVWQPEQVLEELQASVGRNARAPEAEGPREWYWIVTPNWQGYDQLTPSEAEEERRAGRAVRKELPPWVPGIRVGGAAAYDDDA
jgi:hypothetical protein